MPFWDFLTSLLRGKLPNPAPDAGGDGSGPAPMLPDSPNEPAQITSPKVLLVIFNPVIEAATGKRLDTYMGWSRPDDLVGRFIADILQASSGLARYQIAQRIELDEFPVLKDGFRYGSGNYLDAIRHNGTPHSPPGADYDGLLKRFNVLRRIDGREFDEVWLMGFPCAGLYESVMAGAGGFWCNAPPLSNTDTCKRRFAIMGFSYERDVGEMLHSYNHRCEAILARIFDRLDFLAWAYKPNRLPATISADQPLSLFERFMLFDQIAPGRAAIGSVHFAPNGVRDYDLGNPNPVPSECHDWLRFPNFQGDVRMVSAAEWGGGSERNYQRWWLNHLPKAAGRKGGIHNNWWQYVANLDNVFG
jgi:hypothetical protein